MVQVHVLAYAICKEFLGLLWKSRHHILLHIIVQFERMTFPGFL
jgi:hypothetical protein